MQALINIVLFGIFEGILIIKRGSIWMAASVHTVWNFAQGNIFGVSVSGTAKTASLLMTEFAEGSAAAFWNGGAFGSEGGFAVTIVIAVAVASALFLPSNSRELSEIRPAAPDSNF